MQGTRTIFQREFAAYFNSPIAYIFIIAFLVLNSGLFMTGFFLGGAADLRGFFGQLPIFLIFVIPAVSMRLWAEDKRLGTFEMLMTLPMRTRDVMLGKYLAAFAFYLRLGGKVDKKSSDPEAPPSEADSRIGWHDLPALLAACEAKRGKVRT